MAARSDVLYKFVLFRMKELICDDRMRPRYMGSFDRVIEDLFGVPSFSRKIANMYDNRDVRAVIDMVGLDYLMTILNNHHYFTVIEELIRVDHQIRHLKGINKKRERKGKRSKYLIKKYNYFLDLYDDSLKELRKLLDIKNPKTAYKNQFQTLNDLVHRGRRNKDYDDDLFAFDWDDDDLFSMDDPYESNIGSRWLRDEYDGSSPLEDFINALNERRASKKSPSRTRQPRRERDSQKESLYDDYFDPYDNSPLEREEYYEEDDSSQEVDEVESKINRLTDCVMDLSSTVNALVNSNEYDRVNPEVDDEFSSIMETLDNLTKNQKVLAGTLEHILQWKGDLEELLMEEDEEGTEEEDEDEIDVIIEPPTLKKSDTFDEEAPKTRKEMIDQVNHTSGEKEPVAGNFVT